MYGFDIISLYFFGLLLITLIIGVFIGRRLGFSEGKYFFEKNLLPKRLDSSRAVLKGQISEHLAPFLPGFKHLHGECRFIGKPVDFLVFKGMDEGRIDEVVFVEVKTGVSNLSRIEKCLRDAVNEKRVSWELLRFDDESDD